MNIGPYAVLGEIARGGMGVVYRGLDPRSKEEVAIKLLSAGAVATEQQRRRFKREVDALIRLRHPNLARILAVGDHEGQPFLVMGLVEGEALEERLASKGPLSCGLAAEVVLKLARGLEHAHGLGILHRDAKPGNVVLAASGEPVLVDFGIVRDLEASASRLSQTGTFLGTPGYWPPEQARGDLAAIGPTADVYSLGATLYALLTGEPPFRGSLVEILEDTLKRAPDPPSRLRPVDRRLEAVCLRCLEKDPQRRFASAGALAEALEAYLEGEPAPRGAQSLMTAGLFGLAAGLCALALVWVWWAASRASPEAVPPGPDTSAVRPSAPGPIQSQVEPAPPNPRELAQIAAERGDVLLAALDTEGALASYEEAIELAPDWPAGYLGRAGARMNLGDFEGAGRDIAEALRLDPESGPGHGMRGALRAQLGQLTGAEEDFTKAIGHGDETGALYAGRAAVRYSMGRLEESLADVEESLQRFRSDTPQAIHLQGLRRQLRQQLGLDTQGSPAPE